MNPFRPPRGKSSLMPSDGSDNPGNLFMHEASGGISRKMTNCREVGVASVEVVREGGVVSLENFGVLEHACKQNAIRILRLWIPPIQIRAHSVSVCRLIPVARLNSRDSPKF